MTANKRTFEVDRFLTRELLLRNPDNTAPAPNQAVVTDGKGGVFYKYIDASTNAAGFNRLTLIDSNTHIDADLSFNNLVFRQGPGFLISKLNSNTVVFQAVPIIPSSFYKVSTPTGVVEADNISSVLEFEPGYGISLDVSNNKLGIYGNPAYQIIQVSTIDGLVSTVATSTLSSVIFQAGFAISLALNDNVIQINNDFASYALNSLYLQDGNNIDFVNKFNSINIEGRGNIGTYVTDNSTVIISSYSFNTVSTPAGSYTARNTPLIVFNPGYGIRYTQVGQATRLDVSVPSSFQFITTPAGTIGTPNSTNTLNIQSDGIQITNPGSQTIKFSLTSTFSRTLSVNGVSTNADASNTINITTFNTGLVVGSTIQGVNSLSLGTTDFGQIIAGGQTLYSYNTTNGTINKAFKFIGAPGTEITANQLDNSITFRTTSTQGVPAVTTSYSKVSIYSTATAIGQDITDYQYTGLTSINGGPEATLNIVGVTPIRVVPNFDTTKNLFYVGLDASTLLGPVTTALSSVVGTVSTQGSKLGDSTLNISTVTTTSISTMDLNISSLKVLGSLVLSSNPTDAAVISVTSLSSLFAQVGVLTPSSMAASKTASPLISLDYPNNRVGINTAGAKPQATLDVKGLVLAQTFAAYSDPSLKEFDSPLSVTQSDLELLRPWNFRWRSDNSSDVGISAAEVEKVLPSIVKVTPAGLKTVDYSRLSLIGIAGLLETNKRLVALESTVVALLLQAQR